MLGKIKVLENNVRDLHSMCHDELKTNMTSQCYKHCQNIAELIQTLKEDVFFSSLNQPSDKFGLSKMYDKLCNIESDIIKLSKTEKPIETKNLNKSRVPKTDGSCKICQGRTVHRSKAEKSPHYSLPSRSQQMDNNGYNWLRDSIDHSYDRLSFVDLENVPRTRKVYQYPSIESLSSSSSSSIWVDEYYVVPKKKSEHYRIVREKLPFSVESNNYRVYEKRKKNSPRFRKPQNIPSTSVRKYYPRDVERSYKYKQKPREKKKRKRKNEDLKEGDEIYFVTKTKGSMHSGVDTQEHCGGPNSKYVVSRLRRIPTLADLNNGKSRVNAVKFTDRDGEYPQSGEQRRRLSDSNSSVTSIESNFIRAKWRRNKYRRPMKKGRSLPQNSFPNRSDFDHTVYSIRMSSCDDCPPEYITQGQSNQTSRRGKRNLHNNNLKTNPYNSKEWSIVNSNYEVIDSFYRGSLNSRDCKRMKSNSKKPPIFLYHDRGNSSTNISVQGARRNKRDISHLMIADQKSYSLSKTPIAHSMYVNKTPSHETSIGEAPQNKYSMSSSSWNPQGTNTRIPRKVKPCTGQNKGPQNQISVYQIHDKTKSNPFIKNDSSTKSSSAKFTPLKKGSSFFKRRKSMTQKQMSREAIINNTDYSNIKEGDDVNDDTVVPPGKLSAAALLAKTSKTGKLSKAGSKIKNLVRSVSKLKLVRQNTKNSVIDRSESRLPSSIQSDLNTKVESIYKQPSYDDKDSNKLKGDLVGKSRLGGRDPSCIDKANQPHTTKSSDVYKYNTRGLTYILSYEKENRHDVECNHWPTTTSLNHFDSNCTILMSEEKIDLSEHKLNGSHNELHTYRIYPSTTKLANINRYRGVMSPKLTDLRQNSLGHKERKDVDWKKIVNEIKES